MKKIYILSFIIFSNTFIFSQAPKKVLVEEHTGIWCGFCPKAKTALEDCMSMYPNVVGVAMHKSDALSNTYTTAIATGFNISAYPNGVVDRFAFTNPAYATAAYTEWKMRSASRLATTTPVAVNYTSTYNPTTRLLNVNVTASFVGSASGDMRINCVLVEDSIVKPNNPQSNYYGNGCTAADPTTVWYNYPCSIPNYVHNHVARANLANDPWGTAGVITQTVSAGQSFTQNYTYTLPTTWRENHMHIVVFVSKYGANVNQREVMNVNIGPLATTTTQVEENPFVQQMDVKQNTPNPFKEFTAIQFRLNATDNIVVKVYDVLGNEVNTLNSSKLIPGDHIFYWNGDDAKGNHVAQGIYYYRIISSEQQVSKPMIFLGND